MDHLKVLFGEHDPGHQGLLLQSIRRHDASARVTACAAVAELLECAGSQPVDCVVLDDNLSPRGTVALLDELRARLPETPVLVISSREDQETVIDLLRHGVNDFIPKPCALRTDELWERILTAVAKSRQQRRDRRRADRRLQSLQSAAHVDFLTGLNNRRFADRLLHSSRFCGDRRGETAAIFIDLDHFKAVNDLHGHQVGDAVLQAVGEVLRLHSSRADTLIRWGGDEFLAIRSSASTVDAWGWADDVRRTLANTRLDAGRTRLRITATFGVASAPSREFGEQTVILADRALYLAKDWGRDRVCTASMTAAMEIAETIQTYASLTPAERLERLRRESLPALGPTQAERLGSHARRVRVVAGAIGRALRLSPTEIEEVELAAEFHDIGLIAAPEALLAAPRSLSPTEHCFLTEHHRFGADLLRMCGAPEPAAQAVARLHQRFDLEFADGPEFLRGEHTYAQILAVADAVVSMRSCRPYRKSLSLSQTLIELRLERGRRFDPDVVDTAHLLRDTVLAAA